MSWLKNIMRSATANNSSTGKGLILFQSVEEAIQGEKMIKKAGHTCRLVAPPPNLRKGCDLALEINLVEQVTMEKLLHDKILYIGIYPLEGTTELLNIVKITNYQNHIMVKAGNMKLTFDKRDGTIVNASGGGCPDIPYLYTKLVGRKLEEAPRPKDIGFTLCSLMLDRAMEECLSLWEGEKSCF